MYVYIIFISTNISILIIILIYFSLSISSSLLLSIYRSIYCILLISINLLILVFYLSIYLCCLKRSTIIRIDFNPFRHFKRFRNSIDGNSCTFFISTCSINFSSFSPNIHLAYKLLHTPFYIYRFACKNACTCRFIHRKGASKTVMSKQRSGTLQFNIVPMTFALCGILKNKIHLNFYIYQLKYGLEK